MEKSYVLVTGASGFIGKYVEDRLIKGGYPVIALTREMSAYEKRGDELVVEGRLQDPAALEAALNPYTIEVCVHLAWEGIPDYSFGMSEKNLQYGIHVLKLCRELQIQHLIISGSCWEYKNPVGRIEESWPLDDSNHFKAAKNSLHLISHAFCKEYGIRLHWLRLFYVYGPGQRAGSLIPYMVKELRAGRMPALNGGNNQNDFIYVADVADAVVRTIEEKMGEEVLNIGSGEAVRVFDLLRVAAEETGFLLPEGWEAGKEEGVGFYADLERVSIALKWRARTKIRDGVRETLEALGG